MLEYFKLQFNMIKRKLSDGSRPIVGYFLALLFLCLFVAFSIILFKVTEYAPYIYMIVSLYFTMKLSDKRRNDFLKIHFGNSFRLVRILENIIVTLPFFIFLIYKQQYYPTLLLFIISVLLANLNFNSTYQFTIPTPFYKRPYEFTVGFRNSFFMYFIAYGLSIIAIKVDNFSLGVFALLLIYLSIFTFYLKPENEYYVWSYNQNPSQFLLEKIKTAFIYSMLLCIPILILLGISYFDKIGIILLFTLLGFLYLITVILAKYSAYPDEIDISQAIIVGITFIFPPMIIIVIPYFTLQSLNSLKSILK